MKKLSKSKPSYGKILEHFRKQYNDVAELTCLYVAHDKKVCGGEWIDSNGVINITNSIDICYTVKIVS